MDKLQVRPRAERIAGFRAGGDESSVPPELSFKDTSSLVFASERHVRRKFVLCFDGTGNKFHGTDADSNILKIYRMLDRDDPSQFHYYQPGIGTYVSTSSLSHTSAFQRISSWYAKAKDQAVGTSFAEHVMGGYKFLMRYYSVGDDIYIFGFSRGAYTARFLAEMLDHVGLLAAGNEEMCFFAWKTFQKWQMRQERTAKEKAEKKYLLDFMCAFRETFSKPVRRIRFLGLFDTVNSVPTFETAFLERSKFPYTARSTAKVIRHAVAIDERRAKFRSDLISGVKRSEAKRRRRFLLSHDMQDQNDTIEADLAAIEHPHEEPRGRRSSTTYRRGNATLRVPSADRRFSDQSELDGVQALNSSPSPAPSTTRAASTDGASSIASDRAINRHHHHFDDESDDEEEQDIQEVWFAGAHGDSGGGWELPAEELPALSHIPLVWMVKEARKAGLNFDVTKLRALNCIEDDVPADGFKPRQPSVVPNINITSPTLGKHGFNLDNTSSPTLPTGTSVDNRRDSPIEPTDPTASINGEQEKTAFQQAIETAATKGKIHDALEFGQGLDWFSVVCWQMMEYLPFRRMDLQPDGTWRSISWPLPMGETRDVPDNVVVHHSVLKRMEADPSYRPGNLIVGGGGRGTRVAPKECGMGKWKLLRDAGDPVSECWVRDGPPLCRTMSGGVNGIGNGANDVKEPDEPCGLCDAREQ